MNTQQIMLSLSAEAQPTLLQPYGWQSADSALRFLKRQKLAMAPQVARQPVFGHSSVLRKQLWACNTLNGGIHSFMRFCTLHLKEGNPLFNRMVTSFYTRIPSKLHQPGNLVSETQLHNPGNKPRITLQCNKRSAYLSKFLPLKR